MPRPADHYRRKWSRPMVGRDTNEANRAATPLELFFDLCFVVAVSAAAGRLHHALVEGHLGAALIGYATVFFSIWWAWMNFTWFASAYDNDDVVYRLAIFVQIVGVLILAAGVPRAFDDRDFAVVTAGYLVMRVSLAGQWLRAARHDPPRRTTDRRYAFGVSVCMVGWLLLLLVPESLRGVGFAAMAVAELSVPVWAERAGVTSWHPHHIAERYGLFTIIVLGEVIFASSVAIRAALDVGGVTASLVVVVAAGLVIVFGMWWAYFSQPAEEHMDGIRDNFEDASQRWSFIWGYGHLVIFASAAAVGAGIEVAVDHVSGVTTVSLGLAMAAVLVPLLIYLALVTTLFSHRLGRD